MRDLDKITTAEQQYEELEKLNTECAQMSDSQKLTVIVLQLDTLSWFVKRMCTSLEGDGKENIPLNERWK